MSWVRTGITAILVLGEVLIASAKSERISPDVIEQSKPNLRGLADMIPRVPTCPAGYVDQTNGEAYWWECAKNCPGVWPWADKNCGCACVKPDVYDSIMAERAAQEAAASNSQQPSASEAISTPSPSSASIGDTAPAAGTYVASPHQSQTAGYASAESAATGSGSVSSAAATGSNSVSSAVTTPLPASPGNAPLALSSSSSNTGASASGTAPVSLGPATSARVSASEANVIAEVTLDPPALKTAPSTTKAAVSKDDAGDPVLSSLGIFLICVSTMTVFTCCVLAVAVRRSKRRKNSRVAPMPDENVKDIEQAPRSKTDVSHAVQFSHPAMQVCQKKFVQPACLPGHQPACPDLPVQVHHLACPDISIVSRRQKERVMNGGWTAMNGNVNKLSPLPGTKGKPPSIRSDASTRSPSAPPSSSSTTSNSHTPREPS